MEYFKTNSIQLTELTDSNINNLYNKGYLFTRTNKGHMIQTRSLRINLENFQLNSENRRILRKNEDLNLENKELPLENYSWEIHKLGKEFYTKKFGDNVMSAAKIKEMFQEQEKSNMNGVFIYSCEIGAMGHEPKGYCLSYNNSEITHYAYPFYNLEVPKGRNLGMAMMIKAIEWAKQNNKKYIYLGSVTSQTSLYKLQFENLEWWDNENEQWSSNLDLLKSRIVDL